MDQGWLIIMRHNARPGEECPTWRVFPEEIHKPTTACGHSTLLQVQVSPEVFECRGCGQRFTWEQRQALRAGLPQVGANLGGGPMATTPKRASDV
jgi:hypothetical protein